MAKQMSGHQESRVLSQVSHSLVGIIQTRVWKRIERITSNDIYHGYYKLCADYNLSKRAVAALDTRATTNRTMVPCDHGWYREPQQRSRTILPKINFGIYNLKRQGHQDKTSVCVISFKALYLLSLRVQANLMKQSVSFAKAVHIVCLYSQSLHILQFSSLLRKRGKLFRTDKLPPVEYMNKVNIRIHYAKFNVFVGKLFAIKNQF